QRQLAVGQGDRPRRGAEDGRVEGDRVGAGEGVGVFDRLAEAGHAVGVVGVVEDGVDHQAGVGQGEAGRGGAGGRGGGGGPAGGGGRLLTADVGDDGRGGRERGRGAAGCGRDGEIDDAAVDRLDRVVGRHLDRKRAGERPVGQDRLRGAAGGGREGESLALEG